ncbi:type VII secretion target [Gordonia sp. LSe1-13]|uniref:Type VII secretion target n=1 Tax=Gordonia sesuvii TaxID=3116777 RepID=A0ABU7MA34_9ACTN|nr:type VII secretion target [Gordonia sp. LSe1-13]
MRVDPDELRGAAADFTALGGDLNGASSPAVSDSGAGVAWSATAAALGPVDDAVSNAMSVLTGRMETFASELGNAAAVYQDSDVDAAKALKAIGDLNDRPTSG